MIGEKQLQLLEAVADEARGTGWNEDFQEQLTKNGYDTDVIDFILSASPDTVLALTLELRTLRRGVARRDEVMEEDERLRAQLGREAIALRKKVGEQAAELVALGAEHNHLLAIVRVMLKENDELHSGVCAGSEADRAEMYARGRTIDELQKELASALAEIQTLKNNV